jgi:hypothetical protein
MANAETTSTGQVPFRACICLEDPNQTHISSIDAQWETLSVAPPQESVQPASARPRFETLPGMGPGTQSTFARHVPPPLGASKPLHSGQSSLLRSALAVALSIGLAVVAVRVWLNNGDNSEPRSLAQTLAPTVQSHLVTAVSDPSSPPISDRAQPLAPLPDLAAEAPPRATKAEPAPMKSSRKWRPRPRKSELASSDNPY